MTNPNQEPAPSKSPEGLIFLPNSIRDLRNYQLGLLLGRIARNRTLTEVEAMYDAAEEKIKHQQTLLTHAGHIAIASGI